MQILKRAKSGGEIVAFNENEDSIREEVNRRTCKAGHTNREGGPPATGRIMTTSNWGKTKLNIWPRDSDGNLIE